jgi:ribosomal protein S18 acetylase RimI-like enzyme
MAALLIRPVTPSDVAAVRRVLVETWHATYDAVLGAERVAEITGTWHSLGNLAAQVDRPAEVFLLAEAGDAIVATASVVRQAEGARLGRLYVLPTFQGQGIGRALMDEALRLAGDPDPVTLEVEPTNAPAIRFYEMAGFRIIDRTGACGAPDSGVAALVMERRRGTG